MPKFVVTKNGKAVGKLYRSREEAERSAERERSADPPADIRVEALPVVTVGEGLDPDEGRALVDAILDGADFSNLPPEHLGPISPSGEDEGEATPDPAPGSEGPGKEKKAMEFGKKKGIAAPAKAFSFFVSHPSYVPVANEVLEELWAQDRIAVPVPSKRAAGEASEGPKATKPQKVLNKNAEKYLADLAWWGGFAWVETRVRPGAAKVGRVVPQQTRDVRVTFAAPKHPQHAGEPAQKENEVVLRTLQLEDVKEIIPDEATLLRAERPLGGTILPWKAAGSRLQAMVDGVPLKRTWSNLTPLQRRAACAEFLRFDHKPEYPKLKFLLAPDGAKSGNLDILGVDEDGTEILARVTSLKKGDPSAQSEALELKEKHQRPVRMLLLFCRFSASGHPAQGGSAPSLFPPEPFQVPPTDGVLFVSVEEVLEWVKTQAIYTDKLFAL